MSPEELESAKQAFPVWHFRYALKKLLEVKPFKYPPYTPPWKKEKNHAQEQQS